MTKGQMEIKERLAVLETIMIRVDNKTDFLCESNGEQNQKLIKLNEKQKIQWWLISGLVISILGVAMKVIFS